MRKAEYHGDALTTNVSGCVTFKGEDHPEEDRKRAHQAQQREYLLRQMEEKKQKKEMEKKMDMLYDKQRIAVMEEVNRNQHQFAMQNLAVAQKQMDDNLQNDADRKQREHDWKMADQARDRAEVAWNNATELRKTEAKSFAEKLLK